MASRWKWKPHSRSSSAPARNEPFKYELTEILAKTAQYLWSTIEAKSQSGIFGARYGCHLFSLIRFIRADLWPLCFDPPHLRNWPLSTGHWPLTMGKIHVLPEHVANKIAAGEVEAVCGRERSGVPGAGGFHATGCGSGSPQPKSRAQRGIPFSGLLMRGASILIPCRRKLCYG